MEVEKPKVNRPWGSYAVLRKTTFFWIKKLFINKDARFSLQSHKNRSEIWIVLNGIVSAEIDANQHIAKSGDVLFVPKETKHRLTAIEGACILEVALGLVHENDIIRYEDDYGRAEAQSIKEII
jgi:mannose-6-phosphate isomerase-like protein (cupin superfamily)